MKRHGVVFGTSIVMVIGVFPAVIALAQNGFVSFSLTLVLRNPVISLVSPIFHSS